MVCEDERAVVWDCCDSAACIDGSSLCVLLLLNLKGDLGDLGDLGLRGVFGLPMKSRSSSTIFGLGSVSGCGVVFRAMSVCLTDPWTRAGSTFSLSFFECRAGQGRPAGSSSGCRRITD